MAPTRILQTTQLILKNNFVTNFHSSSLFFIFLLKVFVIFLQEKRVCEVLTLQTLDFDAPEAGLEPATL
jgi:hypothetical protein